MENINNIFQKVIQYGTLVRSSKLDGLKAWNDIKPLFDKQITCVDWYISRKINDIETQNIQEIYDYVHENLNMKGDEIDDTSNHELWEKQHFFLQLIRIIKNNPKFSFVRLAQIAYNIGQLSIYIDSDSFFEGNPREYFYLNELDKVTSYIDSTKCEIVGDELEQLENKLDEKILLLNSQTGGTNYYAKYIKYKNKYLELKSKHKE